jgi:hypothetical protein
VFVAVGEDDGVTDAGTPASSEVGCFSTSVKTGLSFMQDGGQPDPGVRSGTCAVRIEHDALRCIHDVAAIGAPAWSTSA